jgi:hypothetical protein
MRDAGDAAAASRMASAAARWACSAGGALIAGFSHLLRERSRPSAVTTLQRANLVVAFGVIESLPRDHELGDFGQGGRGSGAGR